MPELVLYGKRLLAQASLGKLFTNESGPDCLSKQDNLSIIIQRLTAHYSSRSGPSKSVFTTLVSDSRFSTLTAAVTAAGLTEEAINDLGPLTIFAPTNEAFAKIPSDALAGLLEDVPALTEILLRHVVPKKIVRCSRGGMSYDNAGGSKITVDGRSVSTSAASAKVIAKVRATDGIVYAIDTVV